MLWAALGLAGAAFAMAAQQMEIVKKLERRIEDLERKEK